MDLGPYRYDQQSEAARPPSVFYDGTRLGLEGSMLVTLIVAGLGGMQVGLSSTLGYAVRYAEGLPDQAKPFAFISFFFISLLAMVALAMLLFFGTAIPTMVYGMTLVWLMLRWVGKRRGHDKLASTLLGGAFGLLTGALIALALSAVFGPRLRGEIYVRLFRWPAILSIDGIALTWLTLYPLVSAGAGLQIGWRLGRQIEEMKLYLFW